MKTGNFRSPKKRLLGAITRPQADLHPADMEWLGVGNLMRVAKFVNYCRFGHVLRARKRLYRRAGTSLLEGSGSIERNRGKIEDGFLLDSSCEWPFLGELLLQSGKIIDDRGLTKRGAGGREWIRDVLEGGDLESYPAFLDFGLSRDVVSVISDYLGFIPSLSATVPPGIRLTESHQGPETTGQSAYGTSHFHHLDIHDSPMVYVIVLLRDVTEDGGPFCFLSASASKRVSRELGYRKRGKPHYLSDEEVFRFVDPGELHVLTGTAGTVLFIDPSQCFHYGSRDAVIPRYHAMYAYVSPRRTDFTQWMMAARTYPRGVKEDPARRMLLDPSATG